MTTTATTTIQTTPDVTSIQFTNSRPTAFGIQYATEDQQTATEVDVVHELDLGEHTLFLMSDLSIDIADLSGEPWSYLADNELRLNSDETYRLFISLQEMYQ